MDKRNEIVVITGTDSGIGNALAGIFRDAGYQVLAAYLKECDLDGCLKIKMDIRKSSDIENLCRRVDQLCCEGKILRCLINNAGVALGGPIENLPLELFRENFEVNFFGLVSLTQKLIPLLSTSKGHIINIGSTAGRVAAPFLSPYVSTKFAIEGFTDALRREMLPYGIRTVLIEPGGIATPIWNKAKEQDTTFLDEKYMESMERFKTEFIESGNQGLDSAVAAQRIYAIFKTKNPKSRYIVSRLPFKDRLISLIPASVLDRIFVKLFRMDYR